MPPEEIIQEESQIKSCSRRRFLKRVATGSIGAGMVLTSASKAPAQLKLSDQIEEPPPIPVVEVSSEKLWNGEEADPDVVGEMVDQALI